MVTEFNCKCGNTDPKQVKEYEGCLGYEALICTCCGRFYDHHGINNPNNFSLAFVIE